MTPQPNLVHLATVRVAEIDPDDEANQAVPLKAPPPKRSQAEVARQVADGIEQGLESYRPYDPRVAQAKELAYRMVVLGERLPAAANAIGIHYNIAWKIARQPLNAYHSLFKAEQAYWFAHTADQRRAMYRETETLIDEAVVQSARNIHEIVHDPATPLSLKADVSNKTLDRGGVRAPDKIQQKIEVELSEETFERMVRSRRELAGRPQGVLDRDFAFALERPRDALDSVRAKLKGSRGPGGYNGDPDPSE